MDAHPIFKPIYALSNLTSRWKGFFSFQDFIKQIIFKVLNLNVFICVSFRSNDKKWHKNVLSWYLELLKLGMINEQIH